MKEFGHVLSAETEISPLDLQVLLTFLSRDQNIILFDGKVSRYIQLFDLSYAGYKANSH